MEATGGFEPPNRGFANPRLRPLGYVAPEVTSIFLPPESSKICDDVGAESGTRTHTPFRALRPQRSLSTNFSIPARPASWFTRPFQGEFWQERQDSNPRPLVLETNALAN